MRAEVEQAPGGPAGRARDAGAGEPPRPDAAAAPARRPWTGARRGGRLGNLFFARLVTSPLAFTIPFFLFWVAAYFVLAAPEARRASFDLADRLGRGGGPLRRLWFALRHFYGFGMTLVDRMAILAGQTHRYSFSFHGEEALREAVERGRGVVLVTAHIGSWEIMGQLLRRLTSRVTIVMYDGIQPELRRTMEELAAERSFRVLFTDGSPASAARQLEALRRGEVVGMMGDRTLSGRGAAVPLLGAEVEVPVGPYALAAQSGAPVVHAFALRTGRRRYAFYGSEPMEVSFGDRRGRRADLRRWAAAFAARLEEHLRAHPEQWGNLYPFWGAQRGDRA